jgi:hypothetical protein
MTASRLARTFIKQRLTRGTGERASREAYNALVRMSPDEIESHWGKAWRKLSGQKPLTAKESHRIYSSLGRKSREARTEARRSNLYRKEASQRMAEYYDNPDLAADPQRAQDAGTMYRATHDERYREVFEEGSP